MAQAIAQPPETGCTDHPRPVKGPLGGNTAAPLHISPRGNAEVTPAYQRAVTLWTLVEALQRIDPLAGVIGQLCFRSRSLPGKTGVDLVGLWET